MIATAMIDHVSKPEAAPPPRGMAQRAQPYKGGGLFGYPLIMPCSFVSVFEM